MVGKTLLVINPYSGKGAGKRVLLDIVMQLTDAGCEVTVLPTKKGAATADAISAMLTKHPDYAMVIACGGDGTLSLTVEGVCRSGSRLPIGYVPLGTTNDFASSLGIPTEPSEATAAILAGKPVPHDVGVFNGKHFTYIACCGAFTQTSYSTNQSLKRLLGHTAYVLSAIPALSSIRPIRLAVKTEKEAFGGNFLFCALANTTMVGGIVPLSEKQVHFSDGKFELVMIRMPRDVVELGRVATNLLCADLDDPLIVLRHVSSCKIQAEEAVGWSLDGEDGGKKARVSLSVEKSAVDILK